MKKNNSYRIFKRFLFGGALVASSLLWNVSTFAQNNNLGSVINQSGNVSIADIANGANVTINGDRGFVNWNDLNIQDGQTGNFNFTGGSGVILNKVSGSGATAINGAMNSNGYVYVINPNGLTVGASGVVSTQGFVGTTLNLSNDQMQQYVDGTTNTLNFTAGNGQAVINNGTINATNGNIALVGTQVVNTGNLLAPNGSVDLYAGSGMTVIHNAPSHPAISVTGAGNASHSISQRGFIEANAAQLIAVGGNVMALAINNEGLIRATTISTTADGRILLKAEGGTITNTGGMIAESRSDSTTGSDIEINAGMTGTVNLGGSMAASGQTAGTIAVNAGNINVENAKISALGDATNSNGILLESQGDTNVKSSVVATTNADVNILAEGDVNFGISDTATEKYNSTMVNAYDGGNVNVQGANIRLTADKLNSYITVGSNHGITKITTTVGDLVLNATNGGYAQVGYHFRESDDRVFSMTKNSNSLFSGFDTANKDDMARLAALYVPSANIDVSVKNDLIIQASYNKTNPNDPDFIPGAHIGNAYLAKDLETGKAITKLFYISSGISIPVPNHLSGSTVITVGRDTKITSSGASFARVGHNVRNFVYLWSNGSDVLSYDEVQGEIDLTTGRDLLITALDGGTSGVGHLGNEFQHNAIYQSNDATYITDVYRTTAGRHTILKSDGSRNFGDEGTWNSIAQIGDILMGKAAGYSTEEKDHPLRSGSLYANAIVLSGANVILNGSNGGVSVIGHDNYSNYGYSINDMPAHDLYRGTFIVGYSFNRYKDLDTDMLRHTMTPEMWAYYETLKSVFSGSEEGILHVDGNSRIGREFVVTENARQIKNYVGIFGPRLMKDNKTSAIYLDHGAQLGNGIIDTSLEPGSYETSSQGNYCFRYNIGPYPGEDVNAEYDPIEYYGISYMDYLANNDPLFKLLYLNADDKEGLGTLKIFYPFFKTTDKPEKPEIPRWEEPRYPVIPVWFDPCCCVPCCCDPCVDVCCDPCVDACDPCVKTTCDSYVPKGDDDMEPMTSTTTEPTLAPPQDKADSPELPIPTISEPAE